MTTPTPPRKRIRVSSDGQDHAQSSVEHARDATRRDGGRGDGKSAEAKGIGMASSSHSPSSSQPHSPSQLSAPPPPHPTITQSNSIHSYKRLNHIEEGSYGIVYRAQHIPSGEIVAIKRLKMNREQNGFPITSLREIRTLQQSQTHENIVSIKEVIVGDTLTQIYIAFEFIEHDLRTLITNLESPFTLSEIKSLIQQLLKAITTLHSQWIIHRDIKTSNLLINNRGILKLADFGLARFCDGKMTQLVVTLWYRAPELLFGNNDDYDTAVDMWSVGCVMAELLLQQPLFPGANETEQVHLVSACVCGLKMSERGWVVGGGWGMRIA